MSAGETAAPSPDELLSAALNYAAQGLKIYPVFIPGLKPDGKKDVRVPIRSWSEQATDDLEQVRAWWGGQYRGAGIGVDMGRSGLAVADADVKDGVDGITRLIDEVGEATGHIEVPASDTPSGGIHMWFRDPDGAMGSGANIFGDKEHPSGVDGRGVGGTIFMPPTFVPGYGRYAWADGAAPDFARLPEVPAALAAACPPGGRKKKPAELPAPAPVSGLGGGSLFGGGRAPIVHADRTMTQEQAKARLLPMWERVRDTRSPNGLWQAVADFALHAAHYQCWWNAEAVGAMVLAAYEAGGHGYRELDSDDVRAIAGGFERHAEARRAGDLDNGWVAVPAIDLAAAEAAVSDDAVDALIAEMLTPEQIKNRPGKQYLIKGLLNLDSESWIIGAPGSRKSFVALDMAAHVALGQPWQGRPVSGGTVVIIAAEGSGGMGARMKAWEKQNGRELPANVRTLPRPVHVRDAAGWATLVKACAKLGAVFVVVDTQARTMSGMNENASEDMSVFVSAVTAIRTATGACVLAIHHTGRAGGDGRGHSSMDGAQDTELKVVALAEPLRGELRTEKQKDLPEIEPVALAFGVHQVGVDDDGDPITSLAVLKPDAWRDAEVAAEQPEEWERGHALAIVQLFKVLRDQGGETGLTKAEARTAIVERFYGGQPKALQKSTYYTAWSRAQSKISTDGDPVMTNVSGQRWAIDETALKAMEPVIGTRTAAE